MSESDEVEDFVDKNRNLLTVEPQRKTCAAKRLLRSDRVKGLTGTAEACVLEVTSQLYSPQIPHAQS